MSSRSGGSKRPARRDRPSGQARQARPARPVRGAVPDPVPLERGRATGVLVGLFLFAAGFAVAAVDLTVLGTTREAYLAAVGVGFFGLGVVGFFLNRGTVPRPEAAIWAPNGLRALTGPVRLPAAPVIAVFYLLIAVGVVGNFVIPMFFARG